MIYLRLGVTLQERGESFYNPFLAPLVKELMASGVAEESEGAKVRASSYGVLLCKTTMATAVVLLTSMHHSLT